MAAVVGDASNPSCPPVIGYLFPRSYQRSRLPSGFGPDDRGNEGVGGPLEGGQAAAGEVHRDQSDAQVRAGLGQ
eukprot:CAMPEP_0118953710 /NCGR_PEP_ID=MMETSP1169-20130426/57051_1 /TAXON_ID=36882 /ORGANISM="Pyramimonas obovata, Strain CCMP722" /LENGTH=73 /DNA_ID=CAMNT_0006901231 /DNA_START=131 /DNA_END=352 /DNA_ORIENTATION=-